MVGKILWLRSISFDPIEYQKTIDPRLVNPNVVFQSLQAANDAKRWKLKLENTYIEREILRPVPCKDFQMSLS